MVDAATGELLWQEYERHETRQAERTWTSWAGSRPPSPGPTTGSACPSPASGGAALAPHLGARFVQEVTAVALAVERLHPGTGSVVELGGQDAKIIIFRRDPASGRTVKIASMNDKCAGGTGAVLDKISAKLRISPERLATLAYRGVKLHPVAGKCGVFAETDVNSLQKLGRPRARS